MQSTDRLSIDSKNDNLERIEELLAVANGHLEKAKKRTCLGQGENAVPLMDEAMELLGMAETLAAQLRSSVLEPRTPSSSR